MYLIVLGNAICFIASLMMVAMGFIKEKKKFLLSQCGMNCLNIAGNLCLGGISGVIANLVTLIRNLVCVKWKYTLTLKMVFIALQLGLTAASGCTDIIMWATIASNCVYTYILDTENAAMLKSMEIVSQIVWGIYNFHILNYASLPFNAAAIITNGIAVAAIVREAKAAKQNAAETD